MVDSPCQLECFIIDDICAGCNRTMHEIMNWDKFTDKQKQEIIDRLNQPT